MHIVLKNHANYYNITTTGKVYVLCCLVFQGDKGDRGPVGMPGREGLPGAKVSLHI